MLGYRWSYLIPVLCGVGGLTWSTEASAFQYPPLSDDLNPRQIHGADAWIDGEQRSTGNINQSPADLGQIQGMWSRTSDGNPASGDSFPLMQAGSLPGGLSPHGFNGSGMIPPVNQSDEITNNPLFGGRGYNGSFNGNSFGPNGQPLAGSNSQNQFGQNRPIPNLPNRPNVRASWSQGMSAAKTEPYVGLLGQFARPGVYEIAGSRETLGDLIEKIGGLAKDASGQLRIIRNGRPGQATSYSAAAYFELLPGDLVIADAQSTRGLGTGRSGDASSAQGGVAARQASSGSVQIGFVNLLDRPVVLKLRSEHANVTNILAMMRQESALAPYVKVVLPAGQSQRTQGQPRPDAPLPSETVLIFPKNSVFTERLEKIPEPTKLNADKLDDNTARPQRTPPAQISPDVTQQRSALRSTASDPNQSAVTEVPPPPLTGRESSQNSRFAPQRSGGVRGSMPNQVARDSNMVLAPPAEGTGATQRFEGSIGSLPTRDVPATTMTHDPDTAAAPRPIGSVSDEERDPSSEPSRLNASGNRRPIGRANEDEANLDALVSHADDSDATNTAADKLASSWSIWPPILTAGVSLIALLGFSLSLRRRTQFESNTTAPRNSDLTRSNAVPARTAQVSRHALPAAAPARAHSQASNVPQPQDTSKQNLLDALINNQLPMTQESVTFPSPLQFHGRPTAPRTLRLDAGHELPKPYAPSVAPQPMSRRSDELVEPVSHEVPVNSVRKFRVDPSGSTGPKAQFIPTQRAAAAASQATAANVAGATPIKAAAGNVRSPLDRALSTVQKREERS